MLIGFTNHLPTIFWVLWGIRNSSKNLLWLWSCCLSICQPSYQLANLMQSGPYTIKIYSVIPYYTILYSIIQYDNTIYSSILPYFSSTCHVSCLHGNFFATFHGYITSGGFTRKIHCEVMLNSFKKQIIYICKCIYNNISKNIYIQWCVNIYIYIYIIWYMII